MSDIAIQVRNLSKRYRIGLKEELNDTFVSSMVSWAKAPFVNFRQLKKLTKFSDNGQESDIIWALNDVSFDVKKGEVLGIIGSNGAGKSTLLKILSRITEPTSGSCRINGRVASLLEVGTGFHSELSGRENIYLNGTILGMSKKEIAEKFDEIVDFSGIERFIDTPVKRYSSGMSVRLAFAVAAFLEPEVLLVDEVLAVGDVTFQKKCLGKIKDVVGGGNRTVLFVSHNMTAIQKLCQRTVLIEGGKVMMVGDTDTAVDSYLMRGVSVELAGERYWDDMSTAPGNDVVRLRAVRLKLEEGNPTNVVRSDQEFGIEIEFVTLTAGKVFNVGVHLFDKHDVQILTSADNNDLWHDRPRPEGTFKSTCYIQANLLAPGLVTARIQIKRITPKNSKLHFRIPRALSFHISDAGNVQGNIYGEFIGVVRPLLKWTTDYDTEIKA